MRTEFICPDGVKIAIPECYRRCRLGNRCAPETYLREVGGDGVQTEWPAWKKPSCTQLLKGTREAWLSQVTPWATEPDSAAFMVVGSAGHSRLESNVPAGSEHHLQAEGWVELDGVIGRFDLVERNEDPGESYTLVDYKVVGSYAIVKALGLVTERVPRVDAAGAPVLYRGRAMSDPVFRIDPSVADLGDYKWQENFYALAWNLARRQRPAVELFDPAVPQITRLRLLMIARDGGTYMAKNRGITRNLYYFEVPRLPEEEIRAKFVAKRDAYLWAVRHNMDGNPDQSWPDPCSPQEAWDGNKCRKYCSVARACVRHGDNPWVRPDQLAEDGEAVPDTRVALAGDDGIPSEV